MIEPAEERIAEWVDGAHPSEEHRAALVKLLPEQNPLYSGRSTNETTRIRGYILARFEKTGLPEEALPYVLEELESGQEAYLVAAAARALRGMESPNPQTVPFLLKAIRNVRYTDDAVSFESYKPRWPLAHHTTALMEILKTFAWLGPQAKSALRELEKLNVERSAELSAPARAELRHALERIGEGEGETDCCALPFRFKRSISGKRRDAGPVAAIPLEDQDGSPLAFGDFFTGKPSIVVFFYSRCDNNNKCSLTITKLARLQQALETRGLAGRLRLAAFTYDPLYDLPPRLRAFGANRGMTFGEDVRLFRTRNGFEELREYFDLGVSFGPATVNRHRIEVYLLDERGRIAASIARLQWEVEEVLDLAETLLRLRRPVVASSVLSVLPPLAIALLPKCPLCWAAYLSVLGLGGLQSLPYRPLLLPVLISLVLLHLVSVFRRSRQTGRTAAFLLSAAGMAALLAGSVLWSLPEVSLSGVVLMFAGSLMNSFRGVGTGVNSSMAKAP